MNFKARFLDKNRLPVNNRFFGRDITNFETQRESNKHELPSHRQLNKKINLVKKSNYFSGPALPNDLNPKKEVYVPRFVVHKRGKSSFQNEFSKFIGNHANKAEINRGTAMDSKESHRRTSSLGGLSRDLIGRNYVSNGVSFQPQQERFGGWRAGQNGYVGLNLMNENQNSSRQSSVQRVASRSPRVSASPVGLKQDSFRPSFGLNKNKYGEGKNLLYRQYGRPQRTQIQENGLVRASFERPPLQRNNSYLLNKGKATPTLNLMAKAVDTPNLSPQPSANLRIQGIGSISQNKPIEHKYGQNINLYSVPKPFPNLMINGSSNQEAGNAREPRKSQNFLGDNLPKFPKNLSNQVLPLANNSPHFNSYKPPNSCPTHNFEPKLNLMAPKISNFQLTPGSNFKDPKNLNLPEIWHHLLKKKVSKNSQKIEQQHLLNGLLQNGPPVRSDPEDARHPHRLAHRRAQEVPPPRPHNLHHHQHNRPSFVQNQQTSLAS